MGFLDQAADGMQSILNQTWVWFNQLNQQEWIALLAVIAGLGFLCMRGFSGRGNI
jgi:hypothetical protein